MYKNHVVGVVVPAYNEEGFVGEVIETLPSFVDRAYVVDDCSTDGTWEEIQSTAERVNAADGDDADSEQFATSQDTERRSDGGTVQAGYQRGRTNGTDEDVQIGGADRSSPFENRICPIQHEENRGVGGAIKTGYQRALEEGVDIVAVMGGDGQMQPEELHRYLDPIVEGKVDYTKGNRLLNRELRREMSSLRLVGNWTLTFLTKIASGYWRTMDPQNGYTAISREALQAIELDRMYEDYGYCNDLLVRLNVADLRVGDVPQRAKYGDEESSIKYRTYIPRVSKMLFRDFLWRLRTKYLVRRFHPLALLYGLGGISVGAGAISLLRSALSRGDSESGESSSAPSGALLMAVGWVTTILAMVFDLEENADKERRFER